jgi:putative Mn2+ efflux pump MntP
MDSFTILAIAIGLSFDTFAVSLSYGLVRNSILFRQAFRVALLLGIFQGGLTIAGYFLGSVVTETWTALNHWIAFGLLAFLGLKMIVEGSRISRTDEIKDFNNKIVLFTIALGTSIDAFAVGVSFALLEVKIWESGILIGLVTFLASMTAIRIGKSTGERLGNRIEIMGGLLLIAIGLKIFLEHIFTT